MYSTASSRITITVISGLAVVGKMNGFSRYNRAKRNTDSQNCGQILLRYTLAHRYILSLLSERRFFYLTSSSSVIGILACILNSGSEVSRAVIYESKHGFLLRDCLAGWLAVLASKQKPGAMLGFFWPVRRWGGGELTYLCILERERVSTMWR